MSVLRLLAVPTLLVAVAGSATAPSTAAPAAAPPSAAERGQGRPDPLLPDLTPLRAGGLYVAREGGTRKLRFDAGLANIGRGAMEVRPNRGRPCAPGKRHASQIIYRDVDDNHFFTRSIDTTFSRKSAGCMVFHPQHNHWHFEAASRYRLFKPGQANNILVRSRKMSFCLLDSARVPEHMGTFHQPLHYRECGRDMPQGISPGWVDIYRSYLTGQSLTLPRSVRHGVFCLGITVDPRDELSESNERNQKSVRAFRLRQGTQIEAVSNGVCAR